MDELSWLEALAGNDWISCGMGLVAVLSLLATSWDNRKKRLGVFGRPKPRSRRSNGVQAEDEHNVFEVDIQNFQEFAASGPIYAVISCVGVGDFPRPPTGKLEDELTKIELFAGPYFHCLRCTKGQGVAVVTIPRIEALRTIGIDVSTASGAVQVELRGEPPGQTPNESILRGAVSLKWPAPLVVSTRSVATVGRYPKWPSWWLYSLILLGTLSTYLFVLTVRGSQLDYRLDGSACIALAALGAAIFAFIRREPMPAARGYREGALVYPRPTTSEGASVS